MYVATQCYLRKPALTFCLFTRSLWDYSCPTVHLTIPSNQCFTAQSYFYYFIMNTLIYASVLNITKYFLGYKQLIWIQHSIVTWNCFGVHFYTKISSVKDMYYNVNRPSYVHHKDISSLHRFIPFNFQKVDLLIAILNLEKNKCTHLRAGFKS